MNNPKVPGYVGSGKPFYWCKDLQELAKGWYRQILTTTNPYTGVALADDPAVNIIELQNEENLFFHGLSSNCCDAVRWRELRAQFTAFVRGKHGSLDNAAAAWQLSAVERTNVFEGAGDAAMLRPIESWFMVREALKWMSPAMNRYAGDLIEFVTQLEREYNGEIARFIKEECGYKGLILGGDWAPCDAALLNDLARYATLPPGTDCIGYHQYSASFHLNPRNRSLSGYRIGPGDYFADGSVLANPRLIPTNYKRMRAVPMICTEMGLPGPNRFALEGQLAAAAYGSLQDFDQITWLQVEWNGYGNNMGGGTINKFNHNWPQIMGQFPGASLLFRNGCVREAPVVVSYQRPVSSYAAKQFPPILDIQNGDPLYHFGDDEKKTVDPAGAPLPGGADPLAFQVGAIEYSIGEPAETTIDTNVLESCINRSNKTVRSITGELALDWGRQLLTINTPCAQGAVGLLAAAKKIELADVTIDCHNDLAAVLVISLDGTPLAKAPRILVQAVTDAHLSGWNAPVLPAGTMVQVAQGGKTQTIALPPGARRIDNMGHQPFEIARVHGTITFRTRSVVNAQPLDLYGYPQGPPAAIAAGDAGASVPLPEDTYFTIVR
ncbi:hypothetical protein GX586_04720 [bacterium]|nr:hypothetical protein [bacterium]